MCLLVSTSRRVRLDWMKKKEESIELVDLADISTSYTDRETESMKKF